MIAAQSRSRIDMVHSNSVLLGTDGVGELGEAVGACGSSEPIFAAIRGEDFEVDTRPGDAVGAVSDRGTDRGLVAVDVSGLIGGHRGHQCVHR